jgi:hypothetical protein
MILVQSKAVYNPRAVQTGKEASMYIPPFDSLLNALGLTKADLEDEGSVRIPGRAFKLLVKAVLASEHFDEDLYLRDNPDVLRAVRANEIESGFHHFVKFGYFEGRKGGLPAVDERWYANEYPDISSGLKQGKIESATSHFHSAGAAEGRSPSAEFEDDAEQWKYAFQAVKK